MCIGHIHKWNKVVHIWDTLLRHCHLPCHILARQQFAPRGETDDNSMLCGTTVEKTGNFEGPRVVSSDVTGHRETREFVAVTVWGENIGRWRMAVIGEIPSRAPRLSLNIYVVKRRADPIGRERHIRSRWILNCSLLVKKMNGSEEPRPWSIRFVPCLRDARLRERFTVLRGLGGGNRVFVFFDRSGGARWPNNFPCKTVQFVFASARSHMSTHGHGRDSASPHNVIRWKKTTSMLYVCRVGIFLNFFNQNILTLLVLFFFYTLFNFGLKRLDTLIFGALHNKVVVRFRHDLLCTLYLDLKRAPTFKQWSQQRTEYSPLRVYVDVFLICGAYNSFSISLWFFKTEL